MKKTRVTAFFLAALLVLTLLPSGGVPAVSAGDAIGNVMHTNVRTYIDGHRIPSYNIDGWMVVDTEHLMRYGFDVVFDGAAQTLTVTRNPNKAFDPIMNFDELSGVPGTVAFSHLHTEIRAFMNGTPVKSFNVRGYLMVLFEDLRDAGNFGTIVWDEARDELKLTLANPERPNHSDYSAHTIMIHTDMPHLVTMTLDEARLNPRFGAYIPSDSSIPHGFTLGDGLPVFRSDSRLRGLLLEWTDIVDIGAFGRTTDSIFWNIAAAIGEHYTTSLPPVIPAHELTLDAVRSKAQWQNISGLPGRELLNIYLLAFSFSVWYDGVFIILDFSSIRHEPDDYTAIEIADRIWAMFEEINDRVLTGPVTRMPELLPPIPPPAVPGLRTMPVDEARLNPTFGAYIPSDSGMPNGFILNMPPMFRSVSHACGLYFQLVEADFQWTEAILGLGVGPDVISWHIADKISVPHIAAVFPVIPANELTLDAVRSKAQWRSMPAPGHGVPDLHFLTFSFSVWYDGIFIIVNFLGMRHDPDDYTVFEIADLIWAMFEEINDRVLTGPVTRMPELLNPPPPLPPRPRAPYPFMPPPERLLTVDEARREPVFGAYVPSYIPEGFEPNYVAYIYGKREWSVFHGDNLHLEWLKHFESSHTDILTWQIVRAADLDLDMLGFPIFSAEELTLDVIREQARWLTLSSPPYPGGFDQPGQDIFTRYLLRLSFGVLYSDDYGDIMVLFGSTSGSETEPNAQLKAERTEQIWAMFEGI